MTTKFCRCGAELALHKYDHFKHCPFPFDNERTDAPHMIVNWEISYAANTRTNWKAIRAYVDSPLYFQVERDEKGRKAHESWPRYEQIGGTMYDTLTGHTADYRSPL